MGWRRGNRQRLTVLASGSLVLGVCMLPQLAYGQGWDSEVGSLHSVLEQLYQEMLPLCSQLIGVARGLAGFAATWYIGVRVWGNIARAQPVDFYPLFRPFVIGLCIMLFPSVLGLMNTILKPTVTATSQMIGHSDDAIKEMLKQKQEAIARSDAWQIYVGEGGSGNRDRWYKYTHQGEDSSGEGFFDGIGNDIKFSMEKASYNFRNSIKEWMSEVLQLLYQAAALCINTLRTFQLIVLAILGPLVFGLAVFDGFQHSLTIWIARYINIYLWLPIANIFGSIIGKIQAHMLRLDLSQIEQAGDTFFSRTDLAYLIFLIIGIVGYFTIPSVANYIVHAGGGSAFGQRVTQVFTSATRGTVSGAVAGAGMVADQMGDSASKMSRSMEDSGQSSPYFKGREEQETSSFQKERIKGNS
ncbi:MAG: conjugative transposon protein TraJ [Sphingobacterium sp.]